MSEKMDLDFFKEEVFRAYNVLAPHNAELQNDEDIHEWYYEGLITKTEFNILLKYNWSIIDSLI